MVAKSFRGESKGGRSVKADSVSQDSPRLLSPERQEQRARNVLLYQLSRSAKSAKQCRDILAKREIDPEIAEAVIQRYIEVGLIDDLLYAQTIVSARRKFKGMAKTAIKRELGEKGIAPALIESATENLDAESELASATDLAIKRIGRLATLDKVVRERRLMGYLARKGYSSAQIVPAMKAAEAQLAQM
ncbi:MAG: hypothetical protein RLZZ164_1160 [Actinomycetota bacterium]|jgi:regulatory protein